MVERQLHSDSNPILQYSITPFLIDPCIISIIRLALILVMGPFNFNQCPYRLVRPRISRPQREDRGSNPLGDATYNWVGLASQAGRPPFPR